MSDWIQAASMQHLLRALKYDPVLMLRYVREGEFRETVILKAELTFTTDGMLIEVNDVNVWGVSEGEMGKLELKATKSLFLMRMGYVDESEMLLLLVIVPREMLKVPPGTG